MTRRALIDLRDQRPATGLSAPPCPSQPRPRRRHAGQRHGMTGGVMLEALIALPVVLALGLMVVQWAFIHEARAFVSHATLMAARAGAVEHARTGPMRTALARALTPLKVPERRVTDFERRFSLQSLPAVFAHSRIRILNPTAEALQDHGRRDADGRIYLPFRDVHRGGSRPGRRSGLNLADATLLRVQVTYGYPLQVPYGGALILAAARAANRFDPDVDLFHRRLLASGRLPITTTATVRLQSRVFEAEANLPEQRQLPSVPRDRPSSR